MTTSPLAQPLHLPNGTVLKNRIVKSALNEGLGARDGGPTKALVNLYQRWALGGAGLLITGNVMIDRNALSEPGNVVVEDRRHLSLLRAWADAGRSNNTEVWMQINHPGKQSPRSVNPHPVAPSAVPIPGMEKMFAMPRELSIDEIQTIVGRFATTAKIAQEAGFSGVQIHGAHGYLISQFLSPAQNKRSDEYGGPLVNRMRFLVEVYQAMRAEVGDQFPIGLKINSSDLVEGGLTEDDSIEVIAQMAALGLDLVEVSGGNYEKFLFDREDTTGGFFSSYAARLRETISIPLLLTGGFRTSAGMEEAISTGKTDAVGLGRALIIRPDMPAAIATGQPVSVELPRVSTGIAKLDAAIGSVVYLSWYEMQIARLAKGKQPARSANTWRALGRMAAIHGPAALQTRRAH